MKLADALKAIDEEITDLFKDEIKNVSMAVESDVDRRKQLDTGIDRLILVEAIAIELAKLKFKD